MSIIAAVNAAAPGDTIQVGAGTYTETGQMVIDKDLTITGAGASQVLINPVYTSGTGYYTADNGWITVSEGVEFNLSGVTIDGAGQSIKMAVISFGTVNIDSCVIQNIAKSTYSGWGVCILNGTDSVVSNSEFYNIQRIGVHVRGAVVIPAPEAVIENCLFVGKGVGDWVEYGVEFGGGGSGMVNGCTLSNYLGVASSDGSTSAGILATDYYGNGTEALIVSNSISGNSSGIMIGYADEDLTVLDAHYNLIVDNDVAVGATSNAVVDATLNYFGSEDPDFETVVDGPVAYDPWFIDEALTQLRTLEVYVDATYTDMTPGWGYTNFATIQSAIAGVGSKGQILVFAGIYDEVGQIVIDKDLTIIGEDRATTIVRATQDTATSGDPRGWFLVDSGVEFNLEGVTLDGNGYLIYQGIRQKGEGTVTDVVFHDMRYQVDGSPYAGVAIAAFGTGTVDVFDSTFDEIGRVGVLYFGTNLSVSTFAGNTYTGKGTGDWLDYCLDISAGANVVVSNNIITGCQGVASSDSSTSAGVLVTTFFGAGTGAEIVDNTITGNYQGLAVGYDSTDTSVVNAEYNDLSGNDIAVAAQDNVSVDATYNYFGGGAPVVEGPVPFLPYFIDAGMTTLYYPVWNTDQALGYITIQAAIDAANAGDEIALDAIVYEESITLNKRVKLVGAGSGETGGTIITAPGSQVVLLAASGLNGAFPLQLKDLRIAPQSNYGLNITGTVEYLKLNNVHVVGPPTHTIENEVALKISTTGTLRHAIFTDCAFDACDYGWYFAKHGDWGPGGSVVEYLSVSGCTFNDNDYKGIYVEKLSEVTFLNCEVKNNGHQDFWNQIWNGGFDINLKGEELYQNIGILDSVFENNGLGYKEGAAIMIKAREDGATYGAHPAALNGVHIDGCTITGNERGIRFGEPEKDNTTPTNVNVSNCLIYDNVQTYVDTGDGPGSAYGGLVNQTTAMVEASLNYWGQSDGPAAGQIYGSVQSLPYYIDAALTTLYYPVYIAGTGYISIQDAIDAATAGDTITVLAGTFTEELLLNKAVTIEGANAGTAAGVSPGVRGDETIIAGGFIVSAAATIDGVTIQNGRTSGSFMVGVAVSASDVTVQNCIIEDVGMVPSVVAQSDGLSTQPGNNNLTLTDSTIRNNWRGIYLNQGDGHTLLRNLIDGNNGVGVGIGSDGQSNLTLTGNTISNHTLEGWGSSAVGANVVASENSFLNNGISVAHYGGDQIDAAYNWWGDTDPSDDFSGDVSAAPYYLDASLTTVYSPVQNIDQNTHFFSIQVAIDAANAGETLQVGAGIFEENITLDKRLSIIGSGSDETTGTILRAAAGDSKIGVVNLAATGLLADPILLQDMRIEATGRSGVSVGRFTEGTGLNVAYVTLSNVHVIGSNTNPSTEQERGLYVDLTSSLRYLIVEHCAFDNLTYGWYLQKEVSADASTVQFVTVSDTTFNHNNHKGIYAEKLSDAEFVDCTMADNGFDSSVLPSYFQAWSAGVDVNLKAGTYANLTFDGCIITGNAIDEAKEGVGITIKARDDASSYDTFPATVDNVLITGCTIIGNERGIRIGEPGKGNATPTNVVIEQNVIYGNTQQYSGSDGSDYGDVVNATAIPVSADHNYWGQASGPAPGQIAGVDVSYLPYYIDEALTTLYAPVLNITQSTGFGTLQDAVAEAVDYDVLMVRNRYLCVCQHDHH